MKNRLDEVFSVEKLRHTWKEGAATDQETVSARAERTGTGRRPLSLAAEAAYKRFRETIERRFPRRCIETLEPMLVELEQLLVQRFPADLDAAPPQEELLKLTLAIDGLLNRLEDLLEAFELGSAR
jgi:hypothetical protein